ncbi:Gp37 family protein [Rodentibacter abscessus]|uniref:Gp37 family protein n=1 Tax=Rodentibacter abscessus TaxID=3381777 RepID=UPI00399D15A5
MSATLPILESIRKRIEDGTKQFSIELFPDDLEHYNLTDEFGAVLVQYAGSKFESLDSTDIIQQRRKVLVALTVIARSQHDDTGALEMLDQLRLIVVGFKPENCTACHLISEEFAGEDRGLWQYQLIIQTETWQVEDRKPQDLPKFTTALYRRKNDSAKPNNP